MRISDWSSDVCSSDLYRIARHTALVVVRLVEISARLRLGPADPSRRPPLFVGVNVHRSLSRWGQLSQRDEYLDRRARPLSAPAQILQPVSPAAAYRLGCDRKIGRAHV